MVLRLLDNAIALLMVLLILLHMYIADSAVKALKHAYGIADGTFRAVGHVYDTADGAIKVVRHVYDATDGALRLLNMPMALLMVLLGLLACL